MSLREVLPTVWISDRAHLEEGVYVGRYIRIYGPARIRTGTVIGDFVTIGHPAPADMVTAQSTFTYHRKKRTPISLDLMDDFVTSATEIGKSSIIRGPTTIYSGVSVGAHFDCAHHVTIRENCTLGSGCYLKVNTELRREVTIGDDGTIGGTIGDRSRLGHSVTSFGNLMHKYRRVQRNLIEFGPTLENGVFVGRNASVIGPITLGSFAFIGAGAIVTKDVPGGSMVLSPAASTYPQASPSVRLGISRGDEES